METGILKNYDSKRAVTRLCLAIMFFGILIPLQGLAQVIPPPDEEPEVLNPPPALSVADVRLPDLTGIVRNPAAARALGKALFWDMQLGSDKLACASCHFHAGADNRSKNQLSPGLNRVNNPTRTGNPDVTFGNETTA
jgi:cytochrome c peroxidase